MTGEEIHDWIADQLVKQRRKAEPRPENMSENQWKNRFLVSAKLPPPLYTELMTFCKDNNYSVNSAAIAIFTNFFTNAESDRRRFSEQ